MRKKIWTTFLTCALIITASICITSCGKEEPQEIVNPITVTMSITYPVYPEQEDADAAEAEEQPVLENIVDQQFKVEEGSTVSNALQIYCNVNNISTTMDTTSGAITSIDSVTNGDIDAAMSWKYTLNGVATDTPSGEQVLEDGDVIVWIYQ